MPYIFINFKDWRGESFKINIWKDGLDALSHEPDNSWVGKYISVKGLIEPIYHNKRHKYSCISITVTKNDQMTIISEIEAQRRLNYSNDVKDNIVKTSNQDKLNQILNLSKQQPKSQSNVLIPNKMTKNTHVANSALKSTTLTKNQELANLIKQKTTNPPNSGRQTVTQPMSHQVKPQYQQHRNAAQKKESNISSILWICFIIFCLIVFFR
ncbi:TPA: hypothetical protein ACNRJ0_005424 [Escherichia coli]